MLNDRDFILKLYGMARAAVAVARFGSEAVVDIRSAIVDAILERVADEDRAAPPSPAPAQAPDAEHSLAEAPASCSGRETLTTEDMLRIF